MDLIKLFYLCFLPVERMFWVPIAAHTIIFLCAHIFVKEKDMYDKLSHAFDLNNRQTKQRYVQLTEASKHNPFINAVLFLAQSDRAVLC
jgi:hypothetical protein